MPIYSFPFTIPAATTETDPLRQRVELSIGRLVQIDIGFPMNAAALVHVGIGDMGVVLWPSNPDEWFAWNDHVFSFPEEYNILAEPAEFTLIGWNEDDAFAHTVDFWFSVKTLTPEEVEALIPKQRSRGLRRFFT